MWLTNESVEGQQRVRYTRTIVCEAVTFLHIVRVKRTFKADRSVLSCVVIYWSDERCIEKHNKCPRHPQRIFVGCHWKGKRAFSFPPSVSPSPRAAWCTSTTWIDIQRCRASLVAKSSWRNGRRRAINHTDASRGRDNKCARSNYVCHERDRDGNRQREGEGGDRDRER